MLKSKPVRILLFVVLVVLFALATGNEPALIVLKAVVAFVFALMIPFIRRVWNEG